MTNEKIIKQWFRYAARDLRTAEALMGFGTQFKNGAAFHAQQSIEKTMKGFLIRHGKRPPKTHQIEVLAKMIGEVDKSLLPLFRGAKLITKCAVVYRYPDADVTPLSLRQVRSIIGRARIIYDKLL